MASITKKYLFQSCFRGWGRSYYFKVGDIKWELPSNTMKNWAQGCISNSLWGVGHAFVKVLTGAFLQHLYYHGLQELNRVLNYDSETQRSHPSFLPYSSKMLLNQNRTHSWYEPPWDKSSKGSILLSSWNTDKTVTNIKASWWGSKIIITNFIQIPMVNPRQDRACWRKS